MTHGTELDKRVDRLPDPLWRRIVADPEQDLELIALAASTGFADPAAAWAGQSSAWHKPDRLAHKAYAKHVHLSRGEGLALGLGGMITSAFNVAGLGWIQARMAFFIAAAHGFDPHDPMRPAEEAVPLGRVRCPWQRYASCCRGSGPAWPRPWSRPSCPVAARSGR